MQKYLIAALAVLTLVATPAFSQDKMSGQKMGKMQKMQPSKMMSDKMLMDKAMMGMSADEKKTAMAHWKMHNKADQKMMMMAMRRSAMGMSMSSAQKMQMQKMCAKCSAADKAVATKMMNNVKGSMKKPTMTMTKKSG